MKTTIKVLTIGLLSVLLWGCASPGRSYDDSKVAMIKKDATTEAELIQWFGPATTRMMAPDGSKILTWKFASARPGLSGSAGRLEVRFGPDGKVNSYSATGGGR
jgi:hypothetical protein